MPGAAAEAEVDARIFRFIKEGGMNRGMVYDVPTPTDRQPVPRMNRDTLYMGIPIDTSKGYSITVPRHPQNRYVSVYVLDNEHMTLHILKGSGVKHSFDKQEHTRYVVAIPRVQVFDPEGQHLGYVGAWGVEQGEFHRPKGVAVDRDGRVFVSDSFLGVIQVFSPRGDFQARNLG